MEATGRKGVRLTAGGASAILGVNMSGFAIETAAPQAPVSPTPPTIEPLTIRRRGVGLRGYDPERAFTGFTLFSPSEDFERSEFSGWGDFVTGALAIPVLQHLLDFAFGKGELLCIAGGQHHIRVGAVLRNFRDLAELHHAGA